MSRPGPGPERKSVGIIGGIGPQATIDLMQRVVAMTPADDDGDHIHMIVDNDPSVPSRIAALIEKTGPSPAPHLARMARGLADRGADAIAMPCNTAHHYLEEIAEAASPVPVFDMVALAADRLADMKPRPARIGMLASTAVQLTGLYDRALAERGMAGAFPESQAAVLEAIRAIKAGDTGPRQRARIACASKELVEGGAEALLVACTEISLVAEALPGDLPIVDALDVLALAIVDFASLR